MKAAIALIAVWAAWAILAGVAIQSVPAGAAQAGIGELTFCNFGPKIKILSPLGRKEIDAFGEPGHCRATAKIQGVMWECNTSDKAEAKIDVFRRRLVKDAQEECDKFCQRFSDNCEGRFQIPIHCGLQTDREDAFVMGQRLGCRKDCDGQSFVYCSLFNIGFHTDDPKVMAKQQPNCRCQKTLSRD